MVIMTSLLEHVMTSLLEQDKDHRKLSIKFQEAELQALLNK